MASLVYALVSAVLLIIVKELNLKYMNKIRMPIPMEIIIVSDTRVVPQTPKETVPPQMAPHVEHLCSEYDVTPTRPGVRKWAIPMEDTSAPSSSLLDCTCILMMLRMRDRTPAGEVLSFPSPNLVLIFYYQPQQNSKLSASERAHALSAYCSFIICTSR